ILIYNMKKFMAFLALCVLILLLPTVNAKQGHMRLLAVTETADGYNGGIADLYLEIKPGSGRVFLETFPLTKVDTQISTRFAKEIACDFADIDCDKFDFFYTITAESSIIAGPSAGAAISVLTFSLIKNVDFDENVAITGTINSGGLIGPVGGLKAKIEAANKTGLRKVLIPMGESFESIENESLGKNESINESFDLNVLREKYGIEIKEISTLDEAIFEFTGKRFREKKANLTISQDYKDTMKMLAIQLCSRSTKLKNRILNLTIEDNKTKLILDNAINLSDKGKNSFSDSIYYSSASYCFGANVEFSHLSLLQMNLTEEDTMKAVAELRQEIEDFDEIIENEKIMTITDLESYMVVKERLTEASDFADLVAESVENNNTNLRNLAYAIERLNSAKSWSKFFQNTGKEFDFNDEVIKNACRTKLSEVEERLQYVRLYFPQNLESTGKELAYAYQDLEEGSYELCLFKASKAKANVDAVLSVFGVKNSNVGNIVNQKLDVVERNLVEGTEKGVFPILGYSYFEYANSLKDSDPYSALLYSEYALELSNLDIYFKSPKSKWIILFEKIDKKLFIVLVIGIVLGISVAKIIEHKKTKRTAKSKRRK
ncbi:MAG: hypothetical protein IIB81_05230, partial [Nanoarchaeota archaeon]|nr:hypothetical protein [Nanoarchaeota archaeon]